MDAAGVDVTVLSLTAPGCEQLDAAVGAKVAAAANDASRRPSPGIRSVCRASRPCAQGRRRRRRRARARRWRLGLKGWKTHSNSGDSFLDEKRYWPILAKAEELDVPIYLHPAAPMIRELQTYGSRSGRGLRLRRGDRARHDAPRALRRLGRVPAPQGDPRHFGEGLPFQLQRVDHAFTRPHIRADGAAVPELVHPPSDYLRTNMWVSTSGNYLPAAFACTRDALGIDRIVLGTDHPYEEMDESLAFLSGLELSSSEAAELFEGNAAGLGFG